MTSYNIAAHIHHLKTYTPNLNWRAATSEICSRAIKELLRLPPTTETWEALLELFAAWPHIDDVHNWVNELEPQIHHWPWRLRKSILGQAQTRAEKSCVYRLVGILTITDCEDLSGQKLRQWSGNKDWSNLQGIELRKVETEIVHLHTFFSSPYLKQLRSIELNAMESLSTKLLQIFDKIQFPNLVELRLVSLNLTSNDVRDLNQMTFGSNLTLLDLSSNFINGKDVVTMLGNGQLPSLQTLVINYCTINADDLPTIVETLNHPSLQSIVFDGTTFATKN